MESLRSRINCAKSAPKERRRKENVVGKDARADRLLSLLEKKHITLKQLESMLTVKEAQKASAKIIQPKTRDIFRFGIVSDTHLVDKACALTELHAFYERCKKEGVREIVHGGDLLTGQGVYPGQINDLLCFGVDEHIAYAAQNYPKIEGIVTYVVGGNHEESYIKLAGVDALKRLAEIRRDIKYLGMYNATVVLNGVRIMLQHMSGGAPYALSYRPQRYVTNLPAGSKPNLWVGGHLHTSMFFYYRNVAVFLPGAFQRANMFTTRLGLATQLGGWIVEVEVGEDSRHSLLRITPEFIPYF